MAQIAGHFRRRGSGRPRRPAGPAGPRGRAPRRGAERAGSPGARLPSSRTLAGRPRDRAQHGRRRVRPARRRGLARRPPRRRARGWPSGRRPDADGRADRSGRHGRRAALRPARRACPTSRPSRAPTGWRPPAGRWRWAPDDTLGYGDPRGLRVLREALAGYLARARGCASSPGADRRLRRLHPGARRCCARVLRERGAGGRRDRGVRPPPAPRDRRAQRPRRPCSVPVDARGCGRRRPGGRRPRRAADPGAPVPARRGPRPGPPATGGRVGRRRRSAA